MADYSWSGTWQQNTYYEANTFVKYNNIAYISTTGFSGSTTPPPQDMTNWDVFVIGYQEPITPTPTPTLTETPTPTPTPTPTNGVVLINPLLVGVDEYLSVGNEEYLMFVDPTP